MQKDFNITITDVQTDFDVVIQEASGTQVSIGIVNIGKNTANSLIVRIPQQENFRASGTSEQIVGNFAAGDYTIVSFNIISIARNARNATLPRNFTQFSSQNASQPLKIQIDYTDIAIYLTKN